MRIAMISTLSRTVPPRAEGSVELLVSQITEYLVARGHDVTLFALPGSSTSAKLVSPVDTSYVDNPDIWDWQLYEAFQVREAFSRWQEFDVINCHSYYFGLLFADTVPIPSVHSFHIEPGPDYLFLAQRTRNRHLHFCSEYQARDFEGLSNVNIIPHGIDLSAYSPLDNSKPQSYLAWIGRFHPEKGVLAAIEVARQCNLPLKLAGPENPYLRDVVMPAAGDTVTYVGEVSGADKTAFLANAHALLYPIERGEAFGLVLIEAMACGLPVIALRSGAVPEIIDHGHTGFIADTLEELTGYVAQCSTLNRAEIRRTAEQRFSSTIMGERLEALLLEACTASSSNADRQAG